MTAGADERPTGSGRHGVRVTLAAVVLAVSSCSALSGEAVPTPHDGPLRLGGDGHAILCTMSGPDTEYTFAFDAVQNTTDRDLRVDAVRLVGATNATMVGVGHVAPIEDLTLIGVAPAWPPQSQGTAFERKRPMPTTLPAGELANLVLHVRASPPAQVDAVEVTYTRSGRSATVRNSTTFQIRDRCF